MKGAKQNASAFQVETPLLGRAHHHGNVFLEQIQTFEVCRARFLPRTTRAPPEGREWQLLAAGNSWHPYFHHSTQEACWLVSYKSVALSDSQWQAFCIENLGSSVSFVYGVSTFCNT